MTNFLFIFTIFCGFGFFSAEDIPQNRQKNLFCPALEKLKKSLEKAAACRKIGFRHADKRLKRLQRQATHTRRRIRASSYVILSVQRRILAVSTEKRFFVTLLLRMTKTGAFQNNLRFLSEFLPVSS